MNRFKLDVCSESDGLQFTEKILKTNVNRALVS